MASARGSNMMLGLAMQSVLAWSLGPTHRGEYAICLIISTFIAAILSLSLDWSGSYFIASRKIPKHKIINFCLLYIAIISFFLHLSIIIFGNDTLSIFEVPPSAFWASLYWASSLLAFNICSGLLRGLGLFKPLGMISVMRIALTLLGTISFMPVLDMALMAPLYANITANILATFVLVVILLKNTQCQTGLPKSQSCYQLSSYGMRMMGGTVGMIANLQIITLLLSLYATKEEVGYFALAMALLTQIGTLSDVLNNVLMPRISKSENGRSSLVQASAAWVSLVVIITSLVLLLVSDHIIPLLFSDAFIPSIQLLWVLAPGMWLRATSKTLSTYFSGTNFPQIITINTLICITSNILLFFFLTPHLGLMGAALANTLANLIGFLHISFYFKSHTQKRMLGSLIPLNYPVRNITKV